MSAPRSKSAVDQLIDNLGALQVSLPTDVITRLEAATTFDVGFPTDFITETSPWVFGEANREINQPHRAPNR